MASELHPWRFELEIVPSRLHCVHVFEPKLNAQQGAICEAFFSKCFEQSTSWCFGSHFFVARSHRFIAICHCRFLASFFFFFFNLEKKSMERKLLCQLFTATNCSTLARHAIKLICQTTLIQFCSSRYWAMRVSCLVVTSRRSRDRKRDFQLQTTQILEASCLFSFKSILLRTSGKCQSIKRTAWMLNFIYIVQSKWYLRLKISVMGPFNAGIILVLTV